jgi:translation initiation factor 2B subunit (eIF-2B alpha/beta/delta family)
MYEGRIMARRLAAQGVSVEFFTDAALLASLPRADLVLVGCDAMFPDRFINKVGTHALLQMARMARVPAYIVADSFKFLPASAKPFFRVREEKLSEVWKVEKSNLRIRNVYFEAVPLRSCSGLITEKGLCSAEDIPSFVRTIASGTTLRYAQKRHGALSSE